MEIDIQSFFSEEEINRLARNTSFVKRNSPITGFKFLLTFTTGALSVPDGTLAQMTAFLSGVCQTEVSAQALAERINSGAQEFMRKCLLKAIDISKRPLNFDEGLLSGFDHVYVIDSTNIELSPSLAEKFKGSGGGASKSMMRIQFMLDYLKGTVHIKIGDCKLADATTLLNIIQQHEIDLTGQSLFLSDLGYLWF